MKESKLTFKNPVIAAQVQESPFIPHPYLGHAMPPGKDFIGEKDYVGLEEVIAEIKRTNKKVILNIGDSSTSGWDSNVVTQNRMRKDQGLPLIPAFFQYKTYSDYLRDLLGEEYIVINAGTPAHTSLQGSRRLPMLFKRLKKENIQIELLTVYYGNNDSVWDHNRQDKEWVGKKENFLRKLCFSKFREKNTSIVTRVSVQDYKNNMSSIISFCKENKINIVIIEPVTPLYWKPGTRVLNEDLERKEYPGSKKVYQMLDEARGLWQQAIKEPYYSDIKKLLLEEVREKDFIVPRIKREHLQALRSLAQQAQISYICIEKDLDRTEDDIRHFIDYCHPIGKPNELIANRIAAILLKKEEMSHEATSTKEEAPFYMGNFNKFQKLPTDHYTLY